MYKVFSTRTTRFASGMDAFRSSLPAQATVARSRRREGEAEHGSFPRAERSGRPLRPKRAFACWFHTHFVEHGVLTLAKHELDKACKCKKASPDLRVSIKFRPPPRSKRAPSPNNVVP